MLDFKSWYEAKFVVRNQIFFTYKHSRNLIYATDINFTNKTG